MDCLPAQAYMSTFKQVSNSDSDDDLVSLLLRYDSRIYKTVRLHPISLVIKKKEKDDNV